MQKRDPLTAAAIRAVVWMMRYSEYGEESVQWMNGQSEIFQGSSDTALDPIKKELKKQLFARGVKIDELLAAATKRPASKKKRK